MLDVTFRNLLPTDTLLDAARLAYARIRGSGVTWEQSSLRVTISAPEVVRPHRVRYRVVGELRRGTRPRLLRVAEHFDPQVALATMTAQLLAATIGLI